MIARALHLFQIFQSRCRSKFSSKCHSMRSWLQLKCVHRGQLRSIRTRRFLWRSCSSRISPNQRSARICSVGATSTCRCQEFHCLASSIRRLLLIIIWSKASYSSSMLRSPEWSRYATFWRTWRSWHSCRDDTTVIHFHVMVIMMHWIQQSSKCLLFKQNRSSLLLDVSVSSLVSTHWASLFLTLMEQRSLNLNMDSYVKVMRLTPAFAPQFELVSLSLKSNIHKIKTPLNDAALNSCSYLKFTIISQYIGIFGSSLIQMKKLKELKFESERSQV